MIDSSSGIKLILASFDVVWKGRMNWKMESLNVNSVQLYKMLLN